MKYYVYILESKHGKYYTGVTKNLQERLYRHNHGRGGKFTRAHRPLALVFYEEQHDLKSVMKREREIKTLSRAAKERMVNEFSRLHGRRAEVLQQ